MPSTIELVRDDGNDFDNAISRFSSSWKDVHAVGEGGRSFGGRSGEISVMVGRSNKSPGSLCVSRIAHSR